MEKLAGISHEQVIQTYYALGVLFGIIISASSALTFFNIKVVLAGLIPIYLMSALSMQIDAKRPVIQMATGFLISLFLVTAVFAHIASIILVPFVEIYARQQQLNHFYRA